MDFTVKQYSIFYLDADKGVFYDSNTGSSVEMNFPKNAILDMEITNKEELKKTFQSFIASSRLSPSHVIFIFSANISFERNFSKAPLMQIQNDIARFTDFVPFKNVVSKLFDFEDLRILVAINKDFYDTFRGEFESQQFIVDGAMALSVIHQVMPQTSSQLDLSEISGKIESLKQYNIISQEEQSAVAKNRNQKKATNKRIPILLSILGFLLLLLLIIIFLGHSSAPTHKIP